MTDFPEPDPSRIELSPRLSHQLPTIQSWTSTDESNGILMTNFSRVFRMYIENGFPSHEDFIGRTNVNRGHAGKMANGSVDCKLTTLYRCSRAVGNCPSVLYCETCFKSYGICPVEYPLRGVPSDVQTLRDIHAHCLNTLRNPKGN
jgi:hypothetical protein